MDLAIALGFFLLSFKGKRDKYLNANTLIYAKTSEKSTFVPKFAQPLIKT